MKSRSITGGNAEAAAAAAAAACCAADVVGDVAAAGVVAQLAAAAEAGVAGPDEPGAAAEAGAGELIGAAHAGVAELAADADVIELAEIGVPVLAEFAKPPAAGVATGAGALGSGAVANDGRGSSPCELMAALRVWVAVLTACDVGIAYG